MPSGLSSSLRVLHVYKDVYPPVAGGIERHIDSIRTALPDIQHDVIVCGRRLRTRVSNGGPGAEVYVGELGRVWSVPLSPTFPVWLRRYARGAIVHVHMPQPVGELSALSARSGAPLVVTYHADVYRQRKALFLYRPLILKTLRAADVVVTASRALQQSSPLIREAGVVPQVVPYGIDTARWAPERMDAALVDELRSRYGSPHLLAVGRLVPYKGFDRLIAAAETIRCPVVIVGDGFRREALEDEIRERRLTDRVHLVGAVDDEQLAAHLGAASMFALPSWNRAEAFGIALLEAQAAELPVIATDVGTGTSEAFAPGETGLLIPPDDVPALAAAANELLDDPARARAMGQAGRKRVELLNSHETLARGLRAVYEAAWAGAGSPEPTTQLGAPVSAPAGTRTTLVS